MPIPDLDATGLLPEGVHDCTLDEIEQRFGQFQRSDKRVVLVEQLRRYCAQLGKLGIAAFIVVDGSFVTAKDEPGDIDILLALKPDRDLSKDLLPVEYNAISKRRVKQTYAFDLLVAPAQSTAYDQFLAFFAGIRDRTDVRKGVLKVTP